MVEYDIHGLLNPDRKSFVFKREFPDIYNAYKTLVNARWTVDEIDLHRDRADFLTMFPEERHFIMTILMFFKGGDGAVIDNTFLHFLSVIQSPEAKAFMCEQLGNENTHGEMYRILLETVAESAEEAERLLESFDSYPYVKKKMDWVESRLKEELDFRERLITFVAVEGILFSSSFCGLYWLKSKGLCHGITFSNELISRDEGLHTDFGILLYSKFKPLPTEKIHEIFMEAFEVEKNFVEEALPNPLNGIDAPTMIRYVKMVINRLCSMIGVPTMFTDAASPGFMDLISLHGKAQFFERKQEYMEGDLSSSGSNVPFDFKLENF